MLLFYARIPYNLVELALFWQNITQLIAGVSKFSVSSVQFLFGRRISSNAHCWLCPCQSGIIANFAIFSPIPFFVDCHTYLNANLRKCPGVFLL